MRRAIAAALIASTMLAGHAAYAAGHGAQRENTDTARTMDAPYIAVPVVRDGALVNYLFVSVRVDVANNVDIWRMRERAHFLRDALVRAAHRVSLADAEHPDQLNQALALATFRAAAASALGANAVRGVTIMAAYSSRTRSGGAQR